MEDNEDDILRHTRLAIVFGKGKSPDMPAEDVDESIDELERILQITVRTWKADVNAGRPIFVTTANHDGETVSFNGDWNGRNDDWVGVVGLAERNSRYSFLRYTLTLVDRMSTSSSAIDTVRSDSVRELEMKARLQQDSLKWRRKNNDDAI